MRTPGGTRDHTTVGLCSSAECAPLGGAEPHQKGLDRFPERDRLGSQAFRRALGFGGGGTGLLRPFLHRPDGLGDLFGAHCRFVVLRAISGP